MTFTFLDILVYHVLNNQSLHHIKNIPVESIERIVLNLQKEYPDTYKMLEGKNETDKMILLRNELNKRTSKL
jgi:hypothetical protein